MRQHVGTNVCAVCGLYQPLQRMETVSFSQVPNSELLRADGSQSGELPRHAHTTVCPNVDGIRYCMQPAGCTWSFQPGVCSASLLGAMHSYAQYLQCHAADHKGLQLHCACNACCGVPVQLHFAAMATTNMINAVQQNTAAARTHAVAELETLVSGCGVLQRVMLTANLARAVTDAKLHVSVCDGCMWSLKHSAVPGASYVRVDTGSLPIAKSVDEQLLPLNLAESLVVSVLRPMRHHVVLRSPAARGRDNDTYQWSTRGHVVAFPNPRPQMLVKCLPCPLEEMPNVIQVSLVCYAYASAYLCIGCLLSTKISAQSVRTFYVC